ncbi:MAG TPA: GNAT family N-acetyltransferase [Mucilaginibacter sp.]|nr:GNAT family N-acetyltransferase [Mucilaginibacter sp.]
MSIIIQTPAFIIRHFLPDEEDIYLALYDDARVTKYLPVRSREEHAKIFREHLTAGDENSITGRWGLFSKDDNDFIGMCLLRLFDDGGDGIELGYALRHQYWGRGIAGEMANTLLSHMLAIKPDTEFVAVTDLDNVASQRVLEKAGLKRKGNYFRNGEELALFRSR